MIEIAARPDEGAARFRHFLTVHREKAVSEDGGGRAAAGAGQHSRPEQRVKVDDVFADEMVELGAAVFARVVVEGLAASFAIGLEGRLVADGRVQSYIKIFAGRVRN